MLEKIENSIENLNRVLKGILVTQGRKKIMIFL